jgi:hypothetical protein
MKTSKWLVVLMVWLAGLAAYGQGSYLVSVEHKEQRRSDTKYFYLEEVKQGVDLGQQNVLVLDNAAYRVHYFRFSEPSASTYFGCDKYKDQAAGELLSLNDLLSESELGTYGQKQQAIETQCMALFENRGPANALFTYDLSGQDRIKMVKIDLDFCSCKVSRDKFSVAFDTLAMPRKVLQTGVFSDAERVYWLGRIHLMLENRFVESCLPEVNKYTFVVGMRD